MKLTDKYIVNPEFEDLFSFNSEKDELEHEAKMIMFRLLSSFEKMMGHPVQKKEIAEAIGTSPSYITQLFKGDKLINMTTLAKLQKAFDFSFEIEAKKNSANLKEKADRAVELVKLKPRMDLHVWNSDARPFYNTISLHDVVKAKAL